jgi:NAD(P) transhydrogenase
MGAGIIAIEYAKIFRKMGVKVTMLVRSGAKSALERVGLDGDVASKLLEVLHEDSVDIYENTSVLEYDVPLTRADGPITMRLKSSNPDVPSALQVDAFLVATGRSPNTSGWGAEKLGIRIATRGGHLEVDECYETSVKGIFAAGDVIGPPSLASTGAYQAQAAILELFGEGHMNKYDSFPVGMWTTPECGYYGLTKVQAEKKGMDVEEGCVDYSACLRGRVFAPVGLMKLVFKKSDGVIVGVHILGDDACEMVHYGMDLVCQGVSIFKVMTTCFTAVTFHELFKEAALNGNSKLEFGMEWHKILDDIGAHMDEHEHNVNVDKLRQLFEETDEDGNGELDKDELMHVFQRYGCDVSRATAQNLIRLVDTRGSGTIHVDEFFKVFDILEEVRSASHFGGPKLNKGDDAEAAAKAPPVAGA